MKKFKARRRKNHKLLKIIIVFIVLLFCFTKFSYFLTKNQFSSYLFGNFAKKRINDVEFLLKYAINLEYNPVSKEVISIENNSTKDEYYEPLVYLYNTHQKEEYQNSFLETYNIKSNVLIASYILKENLANNNINAIVETSDLVAIRNNMNLKYGKSYYISRIKMEEAFNNNQTLKYFIDLHRDSGSYEKTTLIVGNTSYAKILFVIGLDNPTYQSNLDLANNLNNLINSKVANLSRGVLKKSGKNVNGIYNQDFNKNVLLIEVGGENNTISEVSNTIEILAMVISEYIKGEENYDL